MIDRKTAEAARRRALAIESATNAAELESERVACVATWNSFCAAETLRMAPKSNAVKVYETYRKLGWS